MLKRRELGARIEAGIGDSKGRLPHKEIRVAIMVSLHCFVVICSILALEGSAFYRLDEDETDQVHAMYIRCTGRPLLSVLPLQQGVCRGSLTGTDSPPSRASSFLSSLF